MENLFPHDQLNNTVEFIQNVNKNFTGSQYTNIFSIHNYLRVC